ncbi:hypothetical protein H0H92_009002 [Tricholoma furcatifolium]|nr:hypothetical protein H0H92_009002 [Tricholoma furcatifolium]
MFKLFAIFFLALLASAVPIQKRTDQTNADATMLGSLSAPVSTAVVDATSLASSPVTSSAASTGFQLQNGEEAKALNAQFASLTASSTCTDGEDACVNGGFAQCVDGAFVITQCAGGTICAALPLVDKPGTNPKAIGKKIHAIGSPHFGFHVQVEHNFDWAGTGSLSLMNPFLLGTTDSCNIVDAITPGGNTAALRYDIPGMRRCQEWAVEYIEALVEGGLLQDEETKKAIAEAKKLNPTLL